MRNLYIFDFGFLGAATLILHFIGEEVNPHIASYAVEEYETLLISAKAESVDNGAMPLGIRARLRPLY